MRTHTRFLWLSPTFSHASSSHPALCLPLLSPSLPSIFPTYPLPCPTLKPLGGFDSWHQNFVYHKLCLTWVAAQGLQTINLKRCEMSLRSYHPFTLGFNLLSFPNFLRTYYFMLPCHLACHVVWDIGNFETNPNLSIYFICSSSYPMNYGCKHQYPCFTDE